MDKMIQLFEEFLMKAITMTEKMLAADLSVDTGIDSFADNRDRLLQVIDQISKQVAWNDITDEKRTHLNKQLEYIKKLDEKIIVKFQEFQLEVKKDIEKTYRQKESFKGYNLNDVK